MLGAGSSWRCPLRAARVLYKITTLLAKRCTDPLHIIHHEARLQKPHASCLQLDTPTVLSSTNQLRIAINMSQINLITITIKWLRPFRCPWACACPCRRLVGVSSRQREFWRPHRCHLIGCVSSSPQAIHRNPSSMGGDLWRPQLRTMKAVECAVYSNLTHENPLCRDL